MSKLVGSVGCVWTRLKCSWFWIDIRVRLAADPERAAEFVKTYLANANAPTESDLERWPAASGVADDIQKRRNKVLASTLSKTDIMVLNIYQQGYLSQRMGQALMNMMTWGWDIQTSESRICRAPPSFSFFSDLSDPSRNLNSDSKFQHASVKMFALLPTCCQATIPAAN